MIDRAGDFDYTMDMAPIPLQVHKQIKTPLIEHLGDSFQRFKEVYLEYLSTPPFGRKRVVFTGLSVTDKTTLIMEMLATAAADPDLARIQEEEGFVYEYDYMNTGMGLELGRNVGLVSSPQGFFKDGEYELASLHAMNASDVADNVLRYNRQRRVVRLDEFVGLTSVHGKGVNRFFNLVCQTADEGGLVVVMHSDHNIVEKGLRVRKRLREAPLENIPGILEEEGVEDDRDPKTIKEFYAHTGDDRTREQQDWDLDNLMFRLVIERELAHPSFRLDNARSFGKYPDERDEYIKDIFYPYWLKDVFGEFVPAQGFIIPHEILPEGTKVISYGKILEQAKITNRLLALDIGREIKNPRTGTRYWYLRNALRQIGINPRLIP